MEENIPAPAANCRTASHVISFFSNNLYGSIGLCFGKIVANILPGSSRYSYTKNRMKHTPPTAIGAITWGEDQAYVDPAHDVPRIMSPTPKMKKIVPNISSVARAGKKEDRREPFLKWVPPMSSFRRRM